MTETKKPTYWLFLLAMAGWLLLANLAQGQSPGIDISLSWSTDTYVPLDYPGRALPGRGSTVEVVAVVSPQINPQGLVYNWFLNDDAQKAVSGPGKQAFELSVGESLTQEHLVRVRIENLAGTFLGSSPDLYIPTQAPEIVLKTKSPSLSSSEPGQKYQISANQEIKFIAQPYFFNIQKAADLDYDWNFGEQTASQINQDNPHIFTLRIGSIGQSIERSLIVWAENKNNPLQQSQTSAKVTLVP